MAAYGRTCHCFLHSQALYECRQAFAQSTRLSSHVMFDSLSCKTLHVQNTPWLSALHILPFELILWC